MTSMENIIASIDERLHELDEQIRTLTAARAALHGRETPETKRRQRNPTRRVSRQHDGTAAPAVRDSVSAGVQEAAREISLPTPQTSGVRAKPRRPRKRRSVDVVPSAELEELLSENGGMTTSALAERANRTREQILTALRELEAAGRVRRSGQRRSTRWHAITDEERIQKRAAELAARSTKSG
jgi:predicted HTH transcriptional regulator